VLLLAIAAAAVLMACFRTLKRSAPLDRKELARHSRAAEEACKDWLYPFE
jgi:hypothetical protein